MNTFTKQIILILTLICCNNVTAQTINLDEAKNIASKFFGVSKSGMHKVSKKEDIQLAYTSQTSEEPDFYIFNNGNEFVIVNADAYGNPILAYSKTRSFNPDSIPSNVRYLLSTYKNEVITQKRASNRSSVKEMLTTKWTQRDPYNSSIPLLAPDYTDDYALSAGCSSIATSQIMKYYNYPSHGTGNNSFQMNWRSFGLKTYSADFENTSYDWNNILDDYSNGYTEAQREAVATLVYHVTVASNTRYGQIIGKGSSNNKGDAGYALAKYFRYDKGMTRRQRKYYDDETWFDMINNELEANRPIIFQGEKPNGGGHSFVIHGYDSDNDLYAINWGWGGYCDGYYSLAGSYSPLPSYTSSSSDAYSEEQEITIGIQPDAGGTYIPQIGTFDDFTLLDSSYGTTDNVNIDRQAQSDRTLSLRIRYMNCGIGTHSFYRGVKLVDQSTSDSYIVPIAKGSEFEPDEYLTFPATLSFSTSEILTDGHFQVLPIIKIEGGEWVEVLRNPSQVIPTIDICNSSDTNHINNISLDNKITIHNINGIQVLSPSNGINIIRDANGNVVKVKSEK